VIRKFSSTEEAVSAGYTVILGNGQYAQGGEILSRDHYPRRSKDRADIRPSSSKWTQRQRPDQTDSKMKA
jgi:hypothetical protein